MEYRGEWLGNNDPQNGPIQTGVQAMFSRYENVHGPYCFEFSDGRVIDAALDRCCTALANHGPMTGVVGVRANCEFHCNPTTGRVWLRCIHPIRNGEQILANYSLNHRIAWLHQHGFHHVTNF